MNNASLYAVILSTPVPRDPLTLAKALSAARGTPVQDQIPAAKSAWGILADNIEEGEAQVFAQKVSRAGVPCRTLAASALAKLPPVEPLSRMDPSILIGSLTLLAAAGLTVTHTTTHTVKEGPNAAQKVLSTAILLGTGLPIKIGGVTRQVEKTRIESDLVFYADLFLGRPLRRLRVDALHFDYSFLKERKLYQILGNFKLLLGDVAKSAPAAWKNHGAQVLLENKPMNTMGYDSLADLERESRWLLTLQSLKS